ncbi:MAG TPA: response regulator transcription factor [Candidatus Binatia bacterium]|jgi:DNA-binding NarL/FixJ family response regulator|nr:response regulator transcription factor [Candidatus Binatia bacterium]
MKKIRVLLADDHTLVRTGIRMILEQTAGVAVVAEARTGREALHLTKTAQPDVVLMDISMPDLNGLEATASLMQDYPQVRVLILSVHDDEQYVVKALHAGAMGYLLKDATPAELEQALKAVARGETYLSQAVAKHVIADCRRRNGGKVGAGEKDPSRAASLTPRQREVLQLIAEGYTTKEIATRLHLSEHTVETYRRQLLKRLAVRGMAGLVRSAVRLGLVPPDR